MEFRSETTVSAPVDRVWAIYADVERWAEWTASITEVRLLDPGPLRLGSRAHIVQPQLPPADWTVTELVDTEAERSFAWASTAPGLRTVGRHIVRPTDAGCVAMAVIEQHGPLGFLVGLAYRRLIERYLDWEAAGLRTRAESTD